MYFPDEIGTFQIMHFPGKICTSLVPYYALPRWIMQFPGQIMHFPGQIMHFLSQLCRIINVSVFNFYYTSFSYCR